MTNGVLLNRRYQSSTYSDNDEILEVMERELDPTMTKILVFPSLFQKLEPLIPR